jgi:hypothetical protein
MIAIGLAMAAARRLALDLRIAVLSAATCAAIVVMGLGIARASGSAYDIRAISAVIGRLEAQGAPLAAARTYSGQFTFYGRIRSRIEPTRASSPEQWAAGHPDGYLIAFYQAEDWPPAGEPAPVFRSLYRGGGVAIWRARDILAHPEIAAPFK